MKINRIISVPLVSVAVGLSAVMLLAGCNGGSNDGSDNHSRSEADDHSGHAHAAVYYCTMKCEGDKTYDKPGKCPDCKMDLVKRSGHDDEGHMKHMSRTRDWLRQELGEQYDAKVAEGTRAQLTQGRELYDRLCASCHGATGTGDGPAAAGLQSAPADFTDRAHATYYSDRGRLHIIRDGVPESQMAGFGSSLSGDEILSVFLHVRSLYGSESEEPSSGHGHGDHDH